MASLLIVTGLFALILVALRLYDWHAEKREWMRLAVMQPAKPRLYDPAMVADLPEPARRFFTFAIKPGTPLLTVVEIDMVGEFSLGSRNKPNYKAMRARQILAAPTGFVWKLWLSGMVPISGSDSGKWTRFRIFGLIPVARLGGDANHARSAFGRYVAEAIFWSPAALLPGPNVSWEALDQNSVRVTVTHDRISQTVDINIDAEGCPVSIKFMRWSDANSEKEYRLQPFGGFLSDFREVQGFRIPFNVEAGNMFGTEDYFAFYKANVTGVSFNMVKA